jgi:hypothetical protein
MGGISVKYVIDYVRDLIDKEVSNSEKYIDLKFLIINSF